MEKLINGKAWVIFTFSDGTKQCVYTTLNTKIMKEYGVPLKPHTLFNLHTLQYVPFREDAKSVDIVDTKPIFDEEVLNFASRFI